MNREQIIKALEFCGVGCELRNCTSECPYFAIPLEDTEDCCDVLARDALALIKKLIEENERLKSQNEELCDELTCLEIESDMVERNVAKKMFDAFEKRLDISVVGYSTDEVISDVLTTLNNVIKEVLEENK